MERTAEQQADQFINEETQFHLGYLITEQSHPRTRNLSGSLQRNTREGILMLLGVDDDLPPVITKVVHSEQFSKLVSDMTSVLSGSGRIHFSGCGATGRLSIMLDSAHRRFWRKVTAEHPELAAIGAEFSEKTNAVMTGGDFALIRSVESFEDFISFGYRQLNEAGLKSGDMLVAISEGGETSSVIGTIHAGLDAGVPVSFLFNNPADLLTEHVERSAKVITDARVNVLDLTTGSMSVAGSTRMQATTMELIIAGIAFETALINVLENRFGSDFLEKIGFSNFDPLSSVSNFDILLKQLRTAENLSVLSEYTDFEADIYRQRGRVTYFADEYLLDIFTDTTERAPTFKTPPFHSKDDKSAPDPWAFVKDPVHTTVETWLRVLEHQPRCLQWQPDDYQQMNATDKIIADPPKIDRDLLFTFQIGNESDSSRTSVTPNAAVAFLLGTELSNLDESSCWKKAFLTGSNDFERREVLFLGPKPPQEVRFFVRVDLPRTPLDLFGHLAAKLVLNNVSTGSMGKIGRLSGNWMAHVEASNKKLIDRSVRLISELAEVDYRTACITLFETLEEMKSWSLEKVKTTSPAAWSVEKLRKK